MNFGIMQPDLFGGETAVIVPGNSPYKIFRISANYRKRNLEEQVCGRFCLTCCHIMRIEYHDKAYHKCELMGDSRGPASDINRYCVCNKWEESKV
jgi:hypothetical protein